MCIRACLQQSATPCLCRASKLVSLELMSFVSEHTALSMYMAFWIPRNMSELFKASYRHLISHLLILSF